MNFSDTYKSKIYSFFNPIRNVTRNLQEYHSLFGISNINIQNDIPLFSHKYLCDYMTDNFSLSLYEMSNLSEVTTFESLLTKISTIIGFCNLLYKFKIIKTNEIFYVNKGVVLNENKDVLLYTEFNIQEGALTISDVSEINIYVHPQVLTNNNCSFCKHIVKKLLPYVLSNPHFCSNSVKPLNIIVKENRSWFNQIDVEQRLHATDEELNNIVRRINPEVITNV